MTQTISGLTEIVDQYDLYLIDQFGVLHDGTTPYPRATETLAELRRLKKSVVIISNSGKRSAININRMKRIGIDDSLYDDFVTSGDVAHQYLAELPVDSAERTCYLISRDNDTSAIEALDVKQVEHPRDAAMIVISSSEGDRYDESHYTELLKESASNNTLCLCTNPDKKMLTPEGIKFGAGRIAEIYQEQGGEVHWIGKPYPSIYTHVLNLAEQTDKHRVLCIGDSIEHDIAGGKNSDLTTLLVRTGIAETFSDDEITQQWHHYGVAPDYMAANLRM